MLPNFAQLNALRGYGTPPQRFGFGGGSGLPYQPNPIQQQPFQPPQPFRPMPGPGPGQSPFLHPGPEGGGLPYRPNPIAAQNPLWQNAGADGSAMGGDPQLMQLLALARMGGGQNQIGGY